MVAGEGETGAILPKHSTCKTWTQLYRGRRQQRTHPVHRAGTQLSRQSLFNGIYDGDGKKWKRQWSQHPRKKHNSVGTRLGHLSLQGETHSDRPRLLEAAHRSDLPVTEVLQRTQREFLTASSLGRGCICEDCEIQFDDPLLIYIV